MKAQRLAIRQLQNLYLLWERGYEHPVVATAGEMRRLVQLGYAEKDPNANRYRITDAGILRLEDPEKLK